MAQVSSNSPQRWQNRKLWLGAVLLLTILAAAWPVAERKAAAPEKMQGLTVKFTQSQTAGVNVAFVPLDTTSDTIKFTPIGELFSQQTWASPAPAVVQPAPVAPPLPFTFGGRYTEGNKVILYLMDGNQMLRVQLGDIVKDKYRVDKIEQAAISLTYLPLGTTQILPTGVLLP
jgi:hypothetical protein